MNPRAQCRDEAFKRYQERIEKAISSTPDTIKVSLFWGLIEIRGHDSAAREQQTINAQKILDKELEECEKE